MNNHFYFIFLLLLFIQPLKAAHIIGGDLSYTCLGYDDYLFTMTLYRDCLGGGADFDSNGGGGTTEATVSVFAGGTLIRNMNLDSPDISEIDLNSSIHPCPSTLNLCVEQGVYEFIVTVPNFSDTYTITYSRCCRNATISNMLIPGETGMTFTVDIVPEAQDLCNNTPEFIAPPIPIVCVNEPLELDLSATDEDGDELRYSFCAPFLGGGLAGSEGNGGEFTDLNGVAPNPEAPPPYIDIDFIAPLYSAENPFGSEAAITIDSTTGIISATPNIIGQFVYGVCVEEYRDNVLLSAIKRDFQLNVVDCDPSVCNPNSTREQKKSALLTVQPNPTKGIVKISLSEESISSWKIYNLKGGLVKESELPNDEINFADLSTGLYFLQVQDANGNLYREKVVKM